MPPRWQLLKSRLEGICPKGTDTLQRLWRWRSVPKEQPPFLLQVRALVGGSCVGGSRAGPQRRGNPVHVQRGSKQP